MKLIIPIVIIITYDLTITNYNPTTSNDYITTISSTSRARIPVATIVIRLCCVPVSIVVLIDIHVPTVLVCYAFLGLVVLVGLQVLFLFLLLL